MTDIIFKKTARKCLVAFAGCFWHQYQPQVILTLVNIIYLAGWDCFSGLLLSRHVSVEWRMWMESLRHGLFLVFGGSIQSGSPALDV